MTTSADDARYREAVDRFVRGDGRQAGQDRIATRPGRHVTDRARRVFRTRGR